MLDTFAGATNKHCQRCYQQATSHIMSMFNTEMICMSCKDKEKRHPDYPAAQAAEREAERARKTYWKKRNLPTAKQQENEGVVRIVVATTGRLDIDASSVTAAPMEPIVTQ